MSMGYAVSFSQVCLGFTLLVDSKLIGTPILRGYLSTWGGHVDGGYGGHNRGPHAPKDIAERDQGTDPAISEYEAVLLVGGSPPNSICIAFGCISSVTFYQISVRAFHSCHLGWGQIRIVSGAFFVA